MSEDPDAHALSPSWPNRLLLATIIKDWLVKQAAEGNYLRVPGSSVWACRRPDNIAQYARKLNVWCILSVRIQRLPSPLRPFSREAKFGIVVSLGIDRYQVERRQHLSSLFKNPFHDAAFHRL
ncbi:unnamed protein product [Fusarium graminearum]|nr:unnamed protein product [Fusarium graminearum]